MTLSELMERLGIIRAVLEPQGIKPQVMLWNGDDLTPVTCLDYDRFADDEPYVVLIEKAGDPGRDDADRSVLAAVIEVARDR